ncbi:MAG: acetyl ornithine aminotransferase family protein [Planctomycetota bacterium]|nr:acetyl ornithine aminotransferase family protein [Planctomycetota bacterium]
MIRTELPGPRSRHAIDLDRRYSSPCYTRYIPLAVRRAYGSVVEDLDGNRFLDFTAGIAVNATGHCHPEVVKAIRDQAGKLLHMCGSDYYNEPQAQLAEKLCQIAPGPSAKRVFFTNSGAESVEAAFKLARYHTGRQRVIAFLGGFHGRTFGALSLTGSKITQRAHFAPLVPEVHHIPYGNCYRCAYNLTYPDCRLACVSVLEETLFKSTIPPDEVAAIFVEPIQGEGGYVVPPEGYLRALREVCDRHGILLVADEIQTGFGRTGRMFAIEHSGVEPDILCLAKGIASGMPLGAIVAKQSVMTWLEGAHGSTFGGNPVSCRAALASIELIENGYLRNAARVGEYMLRELTALQKRHPDRIGAVRGRGLMIGVELIVDRKTRKPDKALRDAVVNEIFHQGLIMLGSGESVLRFCPPLCLTRAEAAKGLKILARAFDKLVRRDLGATAPLAPVAAAES